MKIEPQLPEFYSIINEIPSLRNDIIIDDRGNKTIGKRMLEAKLFGFPFIIVAGKDATMDTPLYELHDVNNDKKFLMPKSSIMQYLIDNTKFLIEDVQKTAYIENC